MVYNKVHYATRIAGLCGIVGFITAAFYDIDHPLALILGVENGRFLHEVFFVGSVIALLCGVGWYISLLRRLF